MQIPHLLHVTLVIITSKTVLVFLLSTTLVKQMSYLLISEQQLNNAVLYYQNLARRIFLCFQFMNQIIPQTLSLLEGFRKKDYLTQRTISSVQRI